MENIPELQVTRGNMLLEGVKRNYHVFGITPISLLDRRHDWPNCTFFGEWYTLFCEACDVCFYLSPASFTE